MLPVTILALSDTHFSKATQQLDESITSKFDKVDYIVHAGDYAHESLVETLVATGKFVGVYGNMDPLTIRDMVPEVNAIRFDDVVIGVMHGWGSPADMYKRIHPLCADQGFDIVIFGHSHQKFEGEYKGIKYFNPGSPVDKMFAKTNQYLLLKIDSKQAVTAMFVPV